MLATACVATLAAAACATGASSNSGGPQLVDDAGMLWDSAHAVWSQLAPVGALEVEFYEDIGSMSEAATAVILAEVVGLSPPVQIRMEGNQSQTGMEDGASYTWGGYEVRVVEVVKGSLPVSNATPTGETTIRLDSLVSPQGEPPGLALLFLRSKAEEYDQGIALSHSSELETFERSGYRLVCSQGLFIDYNGTARNPVAEAMHGFQDDNPARPNDPIADSVRQMAFDAVVEMIRRPDLQDSALVPDLPAPPRP